MSGFYNVCSEQFCILGRGGLRFTISEAGEKPVVQTTYLSISVFTFQVLRKYISFLPYFTAR
jgi:hypothetical protein